MAGDGLSPKIYIQIMTEDVFARNLMYLLNFVMPELREKVLTTDEYIRQPLQFMH